MSFPRSSERRGSVEWRAQERFRLFLVEHYLDIRNAPPLALRNMQDACVTAAELTQLYRDFCRKERLPEVSYTKVGRMMTDFGFERLKSNTIRYFGLIRRNNATRNHDTAKGGDVTLRSIMVSAINDGDAAIENVARKLCDLLAAKARAAKAGPGLGPRYVTIDGVLYALEPVDSKLEFK